MGTKNISVGVAAVAEGDGWVIKGARHWYRPKTLEQAKELTNELLWGLAAGLMSRIRAGQQFTLTVRAEGIEFHPDGDLVLAELPDAHPLRVHLGVFQWHIEHAGEKGGD